MYLKLALPPGLSRDGTEYQSNGHWDDQSLTRWYGQAVGPIGGWQPHTSSALTGFCRSILPWRANSGARHLMTPTEQKVYHVGTTGTVVDITPAGFTAGSANSTGGTGYGGGPYGSGPYGVARPDVGVTTEASVWTQDTFGEIWLGCMEGDGNIYEWSPPDTATIASVVTGAPTDCTGVFVTGERIVVAVGAGGDGRAVAWSDVEDRNDWTPTSTNQAGDFLLSTEGTLLKGLAINGQNLLVTTVDAHLMSYAKLPFVYLFQRIGSVGCGAMSKGSIVNMGQQAVWWGRSGFWMFNGGAVTRLQCDIEDYLRINLNRTQRAKISGWHNADFGAVWWHFPSVNAVECDSYAFWDYLNNIWGRGLLDRTAGASKGVFEYPLLVDTSGIVQEHETGMNYDDLPIYAESGPIELGNGDQVQKVQGIIGDENTVGQCEVSFINRSFPNGSETTVAAVQFSSTGKTDLRFTARQVRMRVDFASVNSSSRFGTARLDVMAGGRR